MSVLIATLLLAHPPVEGFTEYDAESLFVLIADHAIECTKRNDRRRRQKRPTRRCMTGSEVETFTAALLGAGAHYGIDPAMLAAIAKVESNWRVDAVGDNGAAYGLFQLHKNAARGRRSETSPCVRYAGSRAACGPSLVCKDMTGACEKSIEAGTLTAAWLLQKLIKKYGARHALVGYNCGPWRCCADKHVEPSGRRRCRRQMNHTSTTKKYMRVYKSIRYRLVGD